MTLQYKLSIAEKSTRGVLQNITPLILDSNQECEIFFYLSNGKSLTDEYYVNLTDSLQQTTRLQIKDSRITLPKKFWREQQIMVIVDCVNNGKIVKSWYCQPLRLAFKENADKLALTVGLDVYGVAERVASLENGVVALEAEIATQSAEIVALTERVAELETASSELSEALEE